MSGFLCIGFAQETWYTFEHRMGVNAMDLLLKIVMNWLLLDVLILATVWYMVSTIQPLVPTWWKVHICDEAPPGCFD